MNKTPFVIGGLIVAALAVGPILSIVSTPGRVINKTLETNNVIANYEMFFDLSAGFTRRVADIHSHKVAIELTTDAAEKNRLSVELLGMKQTCRDLTTQYNSQSLKMNRTIFKSNNLPHELDVASCS